MFVITANNGKFYNGRAGDWNSNLSAIAEAFTYASRFEAERKAKAFNDYTSIHGYTFAVAGYTE